MKTNTFVLLISVLIISCSINPSIEERIEKSKQISDSFVDSKRLKENLADTINAWAKRKINHALGVLTQEWKVDDVIYLNSSRDKSVLFLLKIDKLDEKPMDFVEMIYAKKINSTWKFYSITMPLMLYPDRINGKKPTFEELSQYGKEAVIKGGLFKDGTLEINDDWINGWDKDRLEEKHQKFLNDVDTVS